MASYNIIDILLIAGISYVLFSLLRPKRPARYVKREDVPTSHNQAYNHAPAAHPPSILFKKYTAQELANFDGKGGDSTRGSDGNRILLAIQRRAKAKDDAAPNGWREVRLERTVFDVTSGGSFYGPDGPYGNFAGRDASRGMAKQSFDEDMLTPIDQPLDTLDGLTKDEVDNMQSWHGHFCNKYIVCGELIEAEP